MDQMLTSTTVIMVISISIWTERPLVEFSGNERSTQVSMQTNILVAHVISPRVK